MDIFDQLLASTEALANSPDAARAMAGALGSNPRQGEVAYQRAGERNAMAAMESGNLDDNTILQIARSNPELARIAMQRRELLAQEAQRQSLIQSLSGGDPARYAELQGLPIGVLNQVAEEKYKPVKPNIQYMMSPEGEVVAIDKDTNSIIPMNAGDIQPAGDSVNFGGLITPPPQGLSPKARAAWMDNQIKPAAETLESIKSTSSKLPQLVETVNKLSDLGQKATYSEPGKALDWLAKQAGYSTEGAVARTEYGSIVDNQVLPILKDTFGSQFTKAEGDALRATLGDRDTTPAQKDAVLSSFIRQKINDISALGSKAGVDVSGILKAADKLRIGGSAPVTNSSGWSVEEVN